MWSSVESGGGKGHAVPCARGKHSATLLAGHVYVLGGRGAGGAVPLRDFWRYSLATGLWEKLDRRGEPPPALQEHSATAHGARLYVFGGEPGALSNETPLWIYDTESEVWRKLSGLGSAGPTGRGRAGRARCAGPGGRRGHSALALDDCLLIYGGYKDLRGSTNELWAFHYESESWQQVRTANAGPARHRHAAALHDSRLYVHGGQCDLRDCADLWCYDTMSRVWSQIRSPVKLSPPARSGHAGLRAGAHLYIFGGETHAHPTNELWRFHFATQTWERIVQSVKWPSPRVDGRALLLGGAGPRVLAAARPAPAAPSRPAPAAPAPPPPAPRAPPAALLREISKLSSFHVRRAARCSYSVLAGERDSTESLARQDAAALCKSRSAYVIDERQPADGGESPRPGERISAAAAPGAPGAARPRTESSVTVVTIPKSASVRFARETIVADEDDAELSTSDYASAERVDRFAGGSLGFSNPHYLGPDVRNLGAALTPDSGVGPGDIELRDLGERRARARAGARNDETQLHLLLVGGKEPPHLALLQSPLSMWTYRLL